MPKRDSDETHHTHLSNEEKPTCSWSLEHSQTMEQIILSSRERCANANSAYNACIYSDSVIECIAHALISIMLQILFGNCNRYTRNDSWKDRFRSQTCEANLNERKNDACEIIYFPLSSPSSLFIRFSFR